MGLIHMNGRIFDPLIGRFMSADPFIQAPENLQSHNRFAYLMNNPLSYTDPSGYFSLKKLFRAVVAIVVAIYAPQLLATYGVAGASPLVAGIVNGAVTGFVVGAVSTGTLRGALLGALSGGIFGGIGVSADLGGWSAAARIGAHAVAGCVTSVAGGGQCGSGALSAAFGKFTTIWTNETFGPGVSFAKGVASVVAGGVGSVIAGGKFENGAVTAAYGYLYNELSTRLGADYGPRREVDTRVQAVETGVVTTVGFQNPNDTSEGFGFRIKIQSIDGVRIWTYAHMDPNSNVFEGLLVMKGETIGNYAVPSNGNTTGPHLHLELRSRAGAPILDQGGVIPIPGGRMTSNINPNRQICTNNGCQSRPHNGTDWVGNLR
jgi:murein DD-endopeptidase MepM/ murein hydrolase activator NlpD